MRESRERRWNKLIQVGRFRAGRRDFGFGPLFYSIFKVIFQEVLMYSPIFMYGETENVKEIFYFTKEGWVFEVSKRLLISDCKTDFYPKLFWTILVAVGLQIKHGLAFWKSLDVSFVVPKFQLINRYGLGFIGLGVRSVPRRSKPEEQNLWILFWYFVLEFRMIIFGVLNQKILCVEICLRTGAPVLIRFN